MDRICRQIEQVLWLPPHSTEFGQSGLSIKGSWGPFVPVGAIGDGYLATLAWLSDLLGWTFLYNPDLIAGQISGVVVIDEIEKHLHPRWQREIVLELSRRHCQINANRYQIPAKLNFRPPRVDASRRERRRG